MEHRCRSTHIVISSDIPIFFNLPKEHFCRSKRTAKYIFWMIGVITIERDSERERKKMNGKCGSETKSEREKERQRAPRSKDSIVTNFVIRQLWCAHTVFIWHVTSKLTSVSAITICVKMCQRNLGLMPPVFTLDYWIHPSNGPVRLQKWIIKVVVCFCRRETQKWCVCYTIT